jgi:hypothetical protein
LRRRARVRAAAAVSRVRLEVDALTVTARVAGLTAVRAATSARVLATRSFARRATRDQNCTS